MSEPSFCYTNDVAAYEETTPRLSMIGDGKVRTHSSRPNTWGISSTMQEWQFCLDFSCRLMKAEDVGGINKAAFDFHGLAHHAYSFHSSIVDDARFVPLQLVKLTDLMKVIGPIPTSRVTSAIAERAIRVPRSVHDQKSGPERT